MTKAFCPKDKRYVVPRVDTGLCPNCGSTPIVPTPLLEYLEELSARGEIWEPKIRIQAARYYKWILTMTAIVWGCALVGAIGLITDLLGFGKEPDFKTAGWLFRIFAIIFAALLGTVLGSKSHRLYKIATTPGAISRLQQDPRPPIVYLRPFSADHRFFSIFLSKSPEENLASIAENVGPFIAIGKPGEPEPDVGAHRLYVKESRWQEIVIMLVQHAKSVILQAGISSGVLWELNTLLSFQDPSKFLTYFDPRDKKVHSEFRIFASRALRHPLPEIDSNTGQTGFVYFDLEWKPHVEQRLVSCRLSLRFKDWQAALRLVNPC